MFSLISIVGIAIGLAMDAFAVSIVSSIIIGKISKRHIFRLSFHFGLFQALMPIIGWFAGKALAGYVSKWDHWIAFVILLVIGIKAIYESISNGDGEEDEKKDPSRGWSLIGLSIATSIDALAVGITFGVMESEIILPIIIIGLITSFLSICGIYLGKKLGKAFGDKMAIFGGVVLILIGIKILVTG